MYSPQEHTFTSRPVRTALPDVLDAPPEPQPVSRAALARKPARTDSIRFFIPLPSSLLRPFQRFFPGVLLLHLADVHDG